MKLPALLSAVRFLLPAALALALTSCGVAQGLASRATGLLNSGTRLLLSPIRLSDTPENADADPDAELLPSRDDFRHPSIHER